MVIYFMRSKGMGGGGTSVELSAEEMREAVKRSSLSHFYDMSKLMKALDIGRLFRVQTPTAVYWAEWRDDEGFFPALRPASGFYGVCGAADADTEWYVE